MLTNSNATRRDTSSRFLSGVARFHLFSLLLLVQLACSPRDPLDQLLAAPLEAQERALEGIRFVIQIPAGFVMRPTRTAHDSGALEITHPDAAPGTAPIFTVEAYSKQQPFPTNEHEARLWYQQEGVTLEAIEPREKGWLAITRGKGAVELRMGQDTMSNYAFDCIARYSGKREEQALLLMRSVCSSLALKPPDLLAPPMRGAGH